MILQLVAEVVPVVPINKGVSAATTGILLLDVLPLLTMLPAVSTLRLHAKARRWNDLLAFGIGFALAVIYHVVHMMPGGIAEASLWGVSGATWRTLDILWAQGLLARTFGHVVGVHRPSLATFANLAFPAGVLVMSKTFEVFTLGIASKILSIVVFLTLVAKLSLEGRESMPQYDATRGRAALGEFLDWLWPNRCSMISYNLGAFKTLRYGCSL